MARRHYSSLETWEEGSVAILISPNTLQQCWLMHHAVGCTEQGFASGTGRMGLAGAEVGKGTPCDIWAELPIGGHRGQLGVQSQLGTECGLVTFR